MISTDVDRHWRTKKTPCHMRLLKPPLGSQTESYQIGSAEFQRLKSMTPSRNIYLFPLETYPFFHPKKWSPPFPAKKVETAPLRQVTTDVACDMWHLGAWWVLVGKKQEEESEKGTAKMRVQTQTGVAASLPWPRAFWERAFA